MFLEKAYMSIPDIPEAADTCHNCNADIRDGDETYTTHMGYCLCMDCGCSMTAKEVMKMMERIDCLKAQQLLDHLDWGIEELIEYADISGSELLGAYGFKVGVFEV